MGYQMKNQGRDYASMIGEANQKVADTTDAQRTADIKEMEASGESPNKFFMKAAGMVIGANKRRMASQDAADAAVAQGKQAAYSRKLS